MNRKPNYKLIIGIPLLVIAVCVGTVIALYLLLPKDKAVESTVAKPADIVKQFQTAGTIGELDTLYAKKDQVLVGMNFVSYTAENSYAVNLTATDFVQYEQKDTSAKINSIAAKSNSEAFLTKQGLTKMTSVVKTDLFAVYDSDKTVCQLFDMPPFSTNGALLGLTCIAKSAINDQYSTINKLLALYSGKKSAIASPATVQIRTTTEGNKTLSVTDLYDIGSSKKSLTLVFAAIDDKWEYLGERPLGTGTTETMSTVVDRTISGDLKAKISDPKYEGFLLKNVQ